MPRPSHVRDAVQAVLSEPGHHSWTVEEMLSELGRRAVSADFSSVFRNLTWCQAQGIVERIEVGDGRAHFEASAEHHEHAQCERCGTVVEIPGCHVEAAARNLETLTGFSFTAHRLVFIGLCPGCRVGVS
ncbi:MAG: Fur family transcriptional regulator [Candidatus Dormibacteria bacterium]